MNKSNFYTKLILVFCALFFQFAHAKNTAIPLECNISQIANSPTLVDELADIYNQAINQNSVSAQYQLYEKVKVGVNLLIVGLVLQPIMEIPMPKLD